MINNRNAFDSSSLVSAPSCLLAIFGSILIGGNAQENLITNGSFESPTAPTRNEFNMTIPTGWIGEGGHGAVLFNGNVPWAKYLATGPLAQDGVQYASPGTDAKLSQVFSVSKYGDYILKWYDATYTSGPFSSAPYTIDIIGSSGTVFTNSFIAVFDSSLKWNLQSKRITIAPGTYTLRFNGTGGYGTVYPLVDNVSLLLEFGIFQQPQLQQVPRGGKAVFEVLLTNATPSQVVYQWLFNGVAIDGATANPLVIDNVTEFYKGLYSVRITDVTTGFTINSDAARLEVSAFMIKSFTAMEIEFPSEIGKTYQIEASPDLQAWTDFNDPITGTGQLIYKLFSTRNTNARYFRLKAQ